MADEKLISLYKIYGTLRDLRNDFNHSGMRQTARDAKAVLSDYKKLLPRVVNALTKSERLINLSNHPSSAWSAEQLEAARQYGEIEDMPFPAVDPQATAADISALARAVYERLPKNAPFTLHVMGEMTLTYAIVELCKSRGIKCVASTTERVAEENPDGSKTSTFRFIEFRDY